MRFDSTHTRSEARTGAFSRPASTDTVLWFFDTPSTPVSAADRYRAYLVRVVGRVGSHVEFHFLSVADGSDIPGGPHHVDMQDQRLVWHDLPSTFAAAAPGNDCAFMFLDRHTIDARAAAASSPSAPDVLLKLAADGSGGGTGKWPKSG